MENENKDFLGEENENTMTPEEKVQADISSKIADAAAEVQEEIEAAEENYISDELSADEAEEVEVAEKPEPVKVTVKKNTFILSLIGSAVLGALILLFCMQIPTWVDAMPEGSTVASVNGDDITDLDVSYYIYAQAMTYAQENGIAEDELKDFDWDQEIDGEKLSVTLKNKALEDAATEVITIQKGAENDITIDEATKEQLSVQLNGIKATYGEEGFALRARTMGIASIKQYEKMYEKVMTMQTVEDDIISNPDKYYPEDVNVLNDYIQGDRASVKHILIQTKEDSSQEGKEAAPAEDKLAKAQSVLDRAKAGEDFDALVAEFNEDPGASDSGYTFIKGSGMVEDFENASFALQIGEISELVETTHGYHIIKRIPGLYELQGYWRETSDINVKTRKIAKLSIKDIVADAMAATEELEAEAAAATAGAGN